jgi:hypothetical protein
MILVTVLSNGMISPRDFFGEVLEFHEGVTHSADRAFALCSDNVRKLRLGILKVDVATQQQGEGNDSCRGHLS